MNKLGTVIALPLGRGAAEPTPVGDRPGRGRATLVPFLIGLALLAAVAFLVGAQTYRAAEIGSLPTDVQASLYQQTLTEVRTVCTQSAAASGLLREHCLDQAHFVTLFPQCDAGCRLAAGAVLPQARR